MIIVFNCAVKVVLVVSISVILAGDQLNIVSLREHVDQDSNRFFMRLEVAGTENAEALEEKLRQVLPSDAVISVNPLPVKKVIILVTKEYHCLADILIRNYFGT